MGWFDQIEEFADDQRVLRLRECQKLDDHLKHCRRLAEVARQKAMEQHNVAGTTETSRERKSSAWSLLGMGGGKVTSSASNNSISNSNNNESESESSSLPTQSSSTTTTFASENTTLSAQEETTTPETKEYTPAVARRDDCSSISEHDVWNCRAISLACGDNFVDFRECLKTEENNNNSASHGQVLQACAAEQRLMVECITKKASAFEERLKKRAETKKEEKAKAQAAAS
jgi:hypothetical protein